MIFVKKIIVILCLIIFIVGCQKENNKINLGKLNYDYKIDLLKKDSCSNDIEEYYEINKQKIYYACLKEFYVQENNHKIALKDYLENEDIKNILDEMNIINVYKDGGTTIYHDNDKKLSSDGFTIIRCNTIGGNKNIYIGPNNLEYQDSFCKNN